MQGARPRDVGTVPRRQERHVVRGIVDRNSGVSRLRITILILDRHSSPLATRPNNTIKRQRPALLATDIPRRLRLATLRARNNPRPTAKRAALALHAVRARGCGPGPRGEVERPAVVPVESHLRAGDGKG